MSVTVDLKHKDSIHSFLIGFFRLFLTTCMDATMQLLYRDDDQNYREGMMTQDVKMKYKNGPTSCLAALPECL